MVTYKAILGEPVKVQGVAKAANGEVLREEKNNKKGMNYGRNLERY